MQLLKQLWQDDSAQDTSEYALLLVLITAALVGTVVALRTEIAAVFTSVTSTLSGAT
jgi:Flp pilus assembly pilin Flp